MLDTVDLAVDTCPTPDVVVKFTADATVSTVELLGGVSASICKLRSTVGGASAILNTVGSGVLARSRLLISILPAVFVVFTAADNDDDDERDDVIVTSRIAFVLLTGSDDVRRSSVLLSSRGNIFFSAGRQAQQSIHWSALPRL